MGDRGRLVVPAELRERMQLRPGTALVMVETPHGIVVMSREQAKRLVRESLHDRDLVGALLADRRAAAGAEDAA